MVNEDFLKDLEEARSCGEWCWLYCYGIPSCVLGCLEERCGKKLTIKPVFKKPEPVKPPKLDTSIHVKPKSK